MKYILENGGIPMWYDIQNELTTDFSGYVPEFFIIVPVFAAVLLIFSFLLLYFGICRNTLQNNTSDRINILMEREKLEKKRSFKRVTAFICVVALFGVTAALGIFSGSISETTWGGVLILLADIVIFFIVLMVLLVKRVPLSKPFFVFLSILLVGAAIMQFGVMDIYSAVRLKHLLYFCFVLAMYITLDYALFLILVDDCNDPFRYARGYFDEDLSEKTREEEERYKVRIVQLNNGKAIKVRRFNIYEQNLPKKCVKTVESPRRYFVYYVENSDVVCADAPDSQKVSQISYRSICSVMDQELYTMGKL